MKFRALLAMVLSVAVATGARAHDPTVSVLPVGDGKVSGKPAVGHVLACRSEFRTGGARHVGEWFHGETWRPLEKPHVKGSIVWPDAAFSVIQAGERQQIKSNGLPVRQPTGEFPIARTDPVYVYDTNPNPIARLAIEFAIPAQPERASEPGCLPMGIIGYTLTGVAFFNALDDAGLDAAAHEVQDLCNGHPQGKGLYHYHNSSPCLPGSNRNELVGWSLDGYPILGMRDSKGARLTNADLDQCHGRAETVEIDGRRYDYAYRLTMEYPYTIGCFTGRLLPETQASIRRSIGPPSRRGRDGRPPRRSAG